MSKLEFTLLLFFNIASKQKRFSWNKKIILQKTKSQFIFLWSKFWKEINKYRSQDCVYSERSVTSVHLLAYSTIRLTYCITMLMSVSLRSGIRYVIYSLYNLIQNQLLTVFFISMPSHIALSRKNKQLRLGHKMNIVTQRNYLARVKNIRKTNFTKTKLN